MLSPENIQRYKESFVKGAIGGGAFGTVSGTSQGLTARKDYRGTQEAEAALKAQYEAEKAAGSLTPEKQAEYDIAIEAARKQRESELTSTFEGLPDYNQREENLKALQARMDQMRPSSPAYADMQEQITKAREEAKMRVRRKKKLMRPAPQGQHLPMPLKLNQGCLLLKPALHSRLLKRLWHCLTSQHVLILGNHF
jgi:hypothetical protein